MPAIRLATKRVEKPWGRHDLWPGFEDAPAGGPAIGEVWFQAPKGEGEDDPELLIKYLFTSQKLSIQDHPTDAYARAHGHERGKSEAWQILHADDHATIGLGMRSVMTKEELRASALDGSIEDKMDWKSVHAGEFLYSPAGTVHAIGPGLVVVEIQQNVDLTYRLYDYGSDRELHLDDGIAVADPVPYVSPFQPREIAPGRRLQLAQGAFVVERWTAPSKGTLAATHKEPVWLVPLKGSGTVDGAEIGPGGVWLVDSATPLEVGEGIDLLVCYPGADFNEAILG
jgi:mannose-6-phosphate isomerase